MHLPNTRHQSGPHRTWRADGTTTGGAGQLILPEQESRSMLLVMNISDTDMYLEMGSARAHCALTSGVVSSVTIDNGGKGFTLPPLVQFLGGWGPVTSTFAFAGAANLNAPGSTSAAGRPAQGVAVLTTGVVSSVTIADGGASYQFPPFVRLINHPSDPFGVADPFYSSTAQGILLSASGGSYYMNGTATPTDALAIYCTAASKRFTVKWMD